MPINKQTQFDVDGSKAVSSVLMTLLNQFPGLGTRDVKFNTLAESAGIGFFPTSGAAIQSSRQNIRGRVEQVCLYPFTIVYRASPKTEDHRLRIKEFLDTLGSWLELQPVTINGAEHKLTGYPSLNSGNREIKTITQTNPAHLNQPYQDGVEDWAMSATLQYENKFYK